MVRDGWKLEAISRILNIFKDDSGFVPQYEIKTEDNPTHDPLKGKILRIELAWDFRDKVIKCFRQQDDLFFWEAPWKRRYLTKYEHTAFLEYWCFNREKWGLNQAIDKIYGNMAKAVILRPERGE